MKTRIATVPTGNKGVTALRKYCDENELIFQAEPREDYGIDCYIEICTGESPHNFIIGIQSKAGPSYRKENKGDGFYVYVTKDDLSYWLAANFPVFFVYYDLSEDELYFKHVQLVASQYDTQVEVDRFEFRKLDRASNGRLSTYARALVAATPSMHSRLEISSAGHPTLSLKETESIVLEPIVNATVDISNLLKSDPNDPQEDFPEYNTVLGYSRDEEWICELRITDHDPRDGLDAEFLFLNVVTNKQFTLPLFDIENWDPILSVNDDEDVIVPFDYASYNENVNLAQVMIERLEIVEARHLFEDYSRLLTEKKPCVKISYGAETFDIEIGRKNNCDSLILKNAGYSPARIAYLLLERPNPATMLQLDAEFDGDPDSLFADDESQRYEYVSKITSSDNGKWITFGILTNLDHPCWGTPMMHLVHFEEREIRKSCIEALVL